MRGWEKIEEIGELEKKIDLGEKHLQWVGTIAKWVVLTDQRLTKVECEVEEIKKKIEDVGK